MHELSLCEAIAGVVKPYADGRHVDVVRGRIGALRQVVPESRAVCWTLLRDYEDMPDAELELEFVTAEVRCRSCGDESAITTVGRRSENGITLIEHSPFAEYRPPAATPQLVTDLRAGKFNHLEQDPRPRPCIC